MNEFGTFDYEMLGITEDQLREVDASKAEVVSRVLTPRVRDIVAVFRPDGITFNTTCVRSMINVVFVQLYIDRNRHKMYVSPCMEYDKNSKQWCNVRNGNRISRKITGKPFGNKAYNMMGWSKGYSYRVIGYPSRQEGAEDEYLLEFDLDVFERTLLTEKGLKAAGVEDSELGEDAAKIHAGIAEAQAEKERAREEAKTTGQKSRRRKKVEYYEGVAGDLFGPQKKDYSPKVEIKRLDQMEPFFSEENENDGEKDIENDSEKDNENPADNQIAEVLAAIDQNGGSDSSPVKFDQLTLPIRREIEDRSAVQVSMAVPDDEEKSARLSDIVHTFIS